MRSLMSSVDRVTRRSMSRRGRDLGGGLLRMNGRLLLGQLVSRDGWRIYEVILKILEYKFLENIVWHLRLQLSALLYSPGGTK
jgi:hypothetical protein